VSDQGYLDTSGVGDYRDTSGVGALSSYHVDWDKLRHEAVEAADRAYAPYSGLRVGAAGLCDDGRLVRGCNVENASYGLGLCAECVLVGQLRLTGGGRLVALSCRSADDRLLMPCGRCRQLVHEFGGPDCLIDTPAGIVAIHDVLPDAFGPTDLPGEPR
jgi:cytidine deaminase